MPEASPQPPDPALTPPAWAPRLPASLWVVLFVAGLWVLRNAAVAVTDGPAGIAIVYPATGLVVYALFVTRRRRWPALALLTVVMGVVGSLAFGRTPVQALALNGGATAGAVAAAWLVVSLSGRPTLRTLRGVLVLVLATAAAIAVVSAASYAVLSAARASFAGIRFWVFWGGSTLGILLTTSLLVEWTEPASPRPAGGDAALSAAGIALGLAGGLALLRLPSFPPTGDVVLLPPLLWAALRFGQRGATAAITLGAAAYLAFGPSAGSAGAGAPGAALAVQLFLGVGAVSILAVAAVGEERLAAEARRALLERAMDHSPDPAGILAEDGRVIWANEAAARTAGRARVALIGRRIWELGGSRAGWRALRRRVARGASTAPAPPLGAIEAGEISAALVEVGGQRLIVAVLHDLTGWRRVEETSRLAALGTLAAGVAHEINNPLSYVVSNLAHLTNRLAALPDRDGSLRAEVLEPLAEAEDGARRVRDIVRQLGSFARADEAPGPVDPGRALRSALAMAGNEVRHRARVVTDIAVTPPVIASESRLGQVFLNLLVNAAQSIPDGSAEQHEIRVTLSTRGEHVVLEVADSGPGMSPDTRARVFEPFFTAHAPGTGSGLGLAIAHSVVTRLGGRIEVESTAGEGSLFRVLLPAARGVTAPTPPPHEAGPFTPPPPTARSLGLVSVAPPPAAWPQALRVLVVDDEPLVSKALARLLAGHQVVTAHHGRDALARIRAGERYDAVLCDLMMPELSGMDLHAAVAAVDPELAGRFIFITGGAFTESAREFLARARNPRLEKPVDRSALDAALRNVARA